MSEPGRYHEIPGAVPIRMRGETIARCPSCGALLGVVSETSVQAVAPGFAPEASEKRRGEPKP